MTRCTLVFLAICVIHNAAGDICPNGLFVGERFVDGYGYFGCEPNLVDGSTVIVDVRIRLDGRCTGK